MKNDNNELILLYTVIFNYLWGVEMQNSTLIWKLKLVEYKILLLYKHKHVFEKKKETHHTNHLLEEGEIL